MEEVQIARLVLRPTRTIGALIAMYESNFVRLMRLAPELDRMHGTSVSRVAGALDLYLTVLERFKYTTTILLTYRFHGGSARADDDDAAYEPRARIRIYHDARAVEVLSHHRRRASHKVRPWRRGHMPELDRKWELNRFLQKWLGFCLRQGHLFLCCTTPRVEIAAPFPGWARDGEQGATRGPVDEWRGRALGLPTWGGELGGG